jgi:hemerythrin-like domain-containing protein
MQIYEILKKDHDEVKEMLTELIRLGPDSPAEVRNGLIADIRDALVPHSRAEEAILYNSMREISQASNLVVQGYQEHVEAETLLRALQVTGKIDAGWMTTAKTLKSALEHHIQEEEGKIFQAARQIFTPEEAEMMGEAFESLKPKIKSEGLMATTLELVANVMPPRLSKIFSGYNLESRISK